MKSYQQYCGLARGLDIVGDRWTLLIVRELAISPRRFGQLQTDLAGIPSNLLASRLRSLTTDGLIETVAEDSSPAGYALTPRGFELVPVLQGFVRWATPTMLDGPEPDDHDNIRWVAFAVTAYLHSAPTGASTSMHFTCRDHHVHVTADAEGITVDLDGPRPADVSVDASTWALMGLVSGVLPLERLHVVDEAAVVTGSQRARRRVQSLISHNHGLLGSPR